MIIDLQFVNRSFDRSGWDVILFQRNLEAAGGRESVLVWKRIRRCGYLNRHPIRFPLALSVDCRDPWGNHGPRVEPGRPRPEGSGPPVRLSVDAEGALIEVDNPRSLGAIDAFLYRADRPIGRETALAPGRTARFRFGFDLYIASYPQAEEGEALPWAWLASASQRIRLHGIARATLVMIGAGPGPHSTPLSFHLEEIRHW